MVKWKKLNKQIYLVGVSGGPDSMFLLDNLIKHNYQVIVCHINYQKRKDSYNDENIVKNYCYNNKIKLEILHVKTNEYSTENFQNQARTIRYNFFIKIAKKYQVFQLLLAHNFTDNIETYFLQKQRQGFYQHYGLAWKTNYQQLSVIRPILDIRRETILKYLNKNKIEYANDYTNELEIYQRNIFRKVIKNYSDEKYAEIMQLIDKDNEKLKEIKKNDQKTFAKIIIKDKIKYDLFNKLTISEKQRLLYIFLKSFNEQLIASKNYIKLILSTLSNIKKANIILPLTKEIILIKEYNNIYIDYSVNKEDYSFKISNFEDFSCQYIKIFYQAKQNFLKNQFFFVNENDFPLYIKCNQGDEVIKTSGGTKKINRLFINNKIALRERYFWPVIYNKNHEIIIIPKLATNIKYLQKQKHWFIC